MAVRVLWDKYEAAILLDYCLKVEKGIIDRDAAVAEVSQKLRKRAIDNGLNIDDVFRNKNGISMQMSSIRDCYYGKEKGLTISKLFHEVVDLYKTDPEAFYKIIQEESEERPEYMWQEFVSWLESEHPSDKDEILSSLKIFNVFAHKAKLISKPISEVEEVNEINQLQISVVQSKGKLFQSKRMERKMYYALDVYKTFIEIYKQSNVEIIKEEDDNTENVIEIHDFSADVYELISTNYRYGFPLDSIIDMMRLRNYAEDAGVALPEDDQALDEIIRTIGVVIENKAYAWSEKLINEIGDKLKEVFAEGVGVVFLQCFYDKNAEWLEEQCITNITLLKEILKLALPEYYWSQNIVTPSKKKTEVEAIVDEVNRISGDDHVVEVGVLAQQLEYIPEDKIAWTLSASQEFVWMGEGRYFRTKYFIISDEDLNAIISFVDNECSDKGFVSITDIPLGDIPIDNYELSSSALYSVIFNKVLEDKYTLNGKIITTDENDIDILTLLEMYCKDRQTCSASEVRERAKELTGDSKRQESFIALYNTMIRIDEDKFISEDQVTFDVDNIDKLLNEIIGKSFVPIRQISSFAVFPPCGLGWNYYILESFCYRFSKEYRLSVLSYNDKNAGLIVAEGIHLTYYEMLSEAAANASIELTIESVGEFFFDNGYTTRRKFPNINDIIAKAKTIREEC